MFLFHDDNFMLAVVVQGDHGQLYASSIPTCLTVVVVQGDHGGHYMRNPDGCMPRTDGMPGHCAEKSQRPCSLLFFLYRSLNTLR